MKWYTSLKKELLYDSKIQTGALSNLEGWDRGGRWEGNSRGRGHVYTYG